MYRRGQTQQQSCLPWLVDELQMKAEAFPESVMRMMSICRWPRRRGAISNIFPARFSFRYLESSIHKNHEKHAPSMTPDENYTVFRECLSSAIVARSEDKPKTVKRRQKLKRNGRKEATTSSEIATIYTRADPEELAEFIDV